MPPVSLKPQNYSVRDLWAGKLSEGVQTRFDEMRVIKDKDRGFQNSDTTKKKGRVGEAESA